MRTPLWAELLNVAEAPVRADREALERVYTSPGFEAARQRRADALSVWLAHLKDLVMGWFETSGAAAYANSTRVLVLTLAAAVGLWAVLRWWTRRRARATVLAAGNPATPAPTLEDPTLHRERAQALVGASPREAMREAWLGLLAELERARLARPDRVRTNRELAAELPSRGASPELARDVEALRAWFDGAWYSLEPVEADGAQRFLTRASELARLVPSGGPP